MSEKLTGNWATFVGLEKIGRLATADAQGMPHNTPIYYVLMDGEIYFGTQRTRKKLRNIQANPQVCFTIDKAEWPHKGIMIQGVAEIIEDEAVHNRFREGLIYRYYGSTDNPAWQYVRSFGDPVLVKINAQKFVTWDYSAS